MSNYRVALAGNPNTGKSTFFNELTGLKQHTGNWPGKTVLSATGEFVYNGRTYTLVDLPGTYSLYSNSADEEVARDYIIFGQPDVTVVVLDATALERNMNLALQVLEMTDRVIVCINLIDEARKRGITIDEQQLAERLGVPVVKISARNREGFEQFFDTLERMVEGRMTTNPLLVTYSEEIEAKVKHLEPLIKQAVGTQYPTRWIALRLLDGDEKLLHTLKKNLFDSPEEGHMYEHPVSMGT